VHWDGFFQLTAASNMGQTHSFCILSFGLYNVHMFSFYTLEECLNQSWIMHCITEFLIILVLVLRLCTLYQYPLIVSCQLTKSPCINMIYPSFMYCIYKLALLYVSYCQHSLCTVPTVVRSKLNYFAPLDSEKISAPYFKQCFFLGGWGYYPPGWVKHHASQSQDRNNKNFILYIEFCINNKI
jgi:hypothetical protein